ncbi:MAG: N-acetylmuramic acid 6-phosphate etherase [Tepidisphaeraceae bacterium]
MPAPLQPSSDRGHLLTEQRLADSMTLDAMSIDQAIAVMNAQDRVAVEAVEKVRPAVVQAVQLVAAALKAGGRLVYFGAGTSGRLGVLDASECPPTFRADPNQIRGVIAGGNDAMFRAKEGAEDSIEGGAKDVEALSIGKNDVVMGIATGGTTPYVHGALRRAAQLGAKTIFFSCVQPVPNEPAVDCVIRPLTGPEVLTGSTRLKAGTATKLVLNQITTITMVQLGKCYENLMVDLKASNSKLVDRSIRIIRMITGVDYATAHDFLTRADNHVKPAIVMQKLGVDLPTAKAKLEAAGGRLRVALGQ